jgi:hypothetical protein
LEYLPMREACRLPHVLEFAVNWFKAMVLRAGCHGASAIAEARPPQERRLFCAFRNFVRFCAYGEEMPARAARSARVG